MKFYNTLSRKVEDFKPIEEGKAGLYSCGPTVYNYVHLGNLRAYVFVDLLKRYLRFRGYEVKHVMNITDVDDKTIRDSQKNHKSLREFTDFYEDAFRQDLASMNIVFPEVMPRATDHIQEMVELVKKLLDQGLAYRQGDSVYFKIAGSKGYGELAQLSKQSLKENADQRLNVKDEYDKENANDFVLWKGWKEEDGDVFWETELGKGRPGWHIECSAMSMKYLGETFDIHCGGEDLIFPHHTNEIAQSEGYSGRHFVNYWMHNAHLMIEGQKMSKSLGNFYTLRDIAEKNYLPILVRIVLMKVHYRQNLNFTFAGLDEAQAIAKKCLDTLIDLDLVVSEAQNDLDIPDLISQNEKAFMVAMDDDLNISNALAELMIFLGEINRQGKKINKEQAKLLKAYLFRLDGVLGFIELIYNRYQSNLAIVSADQSVLAKLQKRQELKKAKDYAGADAVRNELLKQGVLISDMPGDKYVLRLSYL
jgi:cysteinyl-tRNA synthetase